MLRTHTIPARALTIGQRIVDRRESAPLRIRAIQVCADGSVRITTNLDEQRLSAAFMVRVLH